MCITSPANISYELHPVKEDITSRTETEFNEDQTLLHRQSLNTLQHSSGILLAIPIQFWYLTSVFSGEVFHSLSSGNDDAVFKKNCNLDL